MYDEEHTFVVRIVATCPVEKMMKKGRPQLALLKDFVS